MATWLHDVEIFASLAEGEPGRARDWGTTRLALAAPDRYVALPDDERCHDIVLAAGPPRAVHSVIEALRAHRSRAPATSAMRAGSPERPTDALSPLGVGPAGADARKPVPSGLANAAAAIATYGLLPEDTEPLAEAVRGALRDDRSEADVWLAYALALMNAADVRALSAAAKNGGPVTDWLLPVLVLHVADRAGALDDAAKEVADELRKGNPMRLYAVLGGLGMPLGALVMAYPDLEHAVQAGAELAHAGVPKLKYPPGSARRRQQWAIREMLIGAPGPAAALLRAAYAQDPRTEWGLTPVAVAAWLGARSVGMGHGDALHDVIFHSAGGDPVQLAAARRAVEPAYQEDLVYALSAVADVPIAVVAGGLLRKTGDPQVAQALLDLHGGDPETNLPITALACVAAWHAPDLVPGLISSADPKQRTLGLVVAEWVPTQEVLEALLHAPVPADPALKLQYARDLASMGDPAVIPTLEALLTQDEQGELGEARALAEEILHIRL